MILKKEIWKLKNMIEYLRRLHWIPKIVRRLTLSTEISDGLFASPFQKHNQEAFRLRCEVENILVDPPLYTDSLVYWLP